MRPVVKCLLLHRASPATFTGDSSRSPFIERGDRPTGAGDLVSEALYGNAAVQSEQGLLPGSHIF